MAELTTKKYEAHAARRGDWWVVGVPAIRGIHTQARRLDQVGPMVRDAIALALDVQEDSFDVMIVVDLPDEVTLEINRLDELRRQLDKTEVELRDAIGRLTVSLRDRKMTMRDVGRLLGLSHQRIAQLIAAGRRETVDAGHPVRPEVSGADAYRGPDRLAELERSLDKARLPKTEVNPEPQRRAGSKSA